MDRLPQDLILQQLLPCLDLFSRFRLAAVSKSRRSIFRPAALPAVDDMPWICGFSGPHRQIPSLLNFNNGLPSLTIHRPAAPLVHDSSYYPVGAFDGCAVLTSWESCGIVIALYYPFSGETRRIIPQPKGLPCADVLVTLLRVSAGLVVIMDSMDRLLVSRLPHFNWVELLLHSVSDFIFYNGEFYCSLKGLDTIFAYKVEELLEKPGRARPRLVYRLKGYIGSSFRVPWYDSQFDFMFEHFVELGGELLLVTRWGLGPDLVEFLVRKFDFSRERITASGLRHVPLVPVYDLGESTLFITESYSMSYSGTIRDPSGFFAKNCIYFVHHVGNRDTGYKLGKFALESPQNYAIFHQHIVRCNMPPIWIAPRFGDLV